MDYPHRSVFFFLEMPHATPLHNLCNAAIIPSLAQNTMNQRVLVHVNQMIAALPALVPSALIRVGTRTPHRQSHPASVPPVNPCLLAPVPVQRPKWKSKIRVFQLLCSPSTKMQPPIDSPDNISYLVPISSESLPHFRISEYISLQSHTLRQPSGTGIHPPNPDIMTPAPRLPIAMRVSPTSPSDNHLDTPYRVHILCSYTLRHSLYTCSDTRLLPADSSRT